ncbi:ROK family protein [Pontibacillus salicampi]|uniref:ROK family protein n=1 Tax=Pontibacillus salicampi TaxID=1449801 RepID=A0ABV6LSI9_9BACI
MSHVIGIDLGGTNMRIAVVTKDGEIMDEHNVPTETERGKDAIMTDLAEQINVFQKRYTTIHAVGIGSPGPLDPFKGVIKNPPNLPGWIDVPLTETLSHSTNLPVYLDNDANVAALAEARKGAGAGKESVYYMTWSTGIGGGYVLNGNVVTGHAGYTGEIGNMIVQPGGRPYAHLNRGSLEGLASGTAIGQIGKERLGIDGGAEAVFTKAKEGNFTAINIIEEAIDYVAIGIANIAMTVDPDVFILGGGVMKANDVVLEPLKRKVASYLYEGQSVHIEQATLGGKAGVIGAAQLAYANEK